MRGTAVQGAWAGRLLPLAPLASVQESHQPGLRRSVCSAPSDHCAPGCHGNDGQNQDSGIFYSAGCLHFAPFLSIRLVANATLLASERFEGNVCSAFSTSLKTSTELQSSCHTHTHAYTQHPTIDYCYYSLLLILNKWLDKMITGKQEITFFPSIPETACHLRPKNCIQPENKQEPPC